MKIAKRQRYCQMAPLGSYLCTTWDFLMFTHEFVAVFKKVPKELNDQFGLMDDGFSCFKLVSLLDSISVNRIIRRVPSSPIPRNSVVMGTTWTFRKIDKYAFPMLCMSKLVIYF